MPKVALSVQFHDDAVRRAVERARASSERSKPHDVSVGIREGKKKDYYGHSTNSDMVEVAMAQEFGTDDIPERSFLRSWFDQTVERNRKQMQEAMVLERRGNAGAVRDLANEWVIEVQKRLQTGEGDQGSVPLAEATIEARARAGLSAEPPLYATGDLAKHVSAEVDGKVV